MIVERFSSNQIRYFIIHLFAESLLRTSREFSIEKEVGIGRHFPVTVLFLKEGDSDSVVSNERLLLIIDLYGLSLKESTMPTKTWCFKGAKTFHMRVMLVHIRI